MRLLRTSEVLRLTGISRTSLWKMRRDGQFPAARRLRPGGRVIGFREDEVRDWLQSRPTAERAHG